MYYHREVDNSFIEIIKKHLVLILSLAFIATVIGVFHYLGWWEAIGLVVLNLGLGIKVKGATTFAATIAKTGGKKALMMTTVGVLIKRHVINLTTKFFAEHSISRYKENIIKLIKMKMDEIKRSSIVQKMKAIGSILLSVPILYFFWSKILGTAIQKFIYALVLPLFGAIFNFISSGFSFLAGLFGFLLGLPILNMIVNAMSKNRFGKPIISAVIEILSFMGDIMNYLNKLVSMLGFDPKHYIVIGSIKINRWLENKVIKGKNSHEKLRVRREIHFNLREKMIYKRLARHIEPKPSLKKRVKELYRLKVKKELTWQEKREKRTSKRKRK